MSLPIKNKKIVTIFFNPSFLLRIGIGGTFFWNGINILLIKDYWIKFIPSFIKNFISPNNFLTIYGIFLIILAIFLVAGFFIKILSLLSFFVFFFIIFFQGINELTFMNFGLAFSSLSLFYLNFSDSFSNKQFFNNVHRF